VYRVHKLRSSYAPLWYGINTSKRSYLYYISSIDVFIFLGSFFLYFGYKYQLWLRFILLFDPLVFFYVMLRNIYCLQATKFQ